jgi:selenoprotein W-related protein
MTEPTPTNGGSLTQLSVEIEYCQRCNFLPRATWIAQELLHTYGEFVASLTLVPAHGGTLVVRVGGEVVFSNKEAGRFPEIRELKELLNERLEAAERGTIKRHPHREDAS